MLNKLLNKNIIFLLPLLILFNHCKNDKKQYEPDNTPENKLLTSDSLEKKEFKKAPEKASFYKYLKGGLKYHVYEYNPENTYPDIGDIIYLNMKYYLNDSLIYSSKVVPGEFKMRIKRPSYSGSIYFGLLQLHENDSAEFITGAYNFFKKTRNLFKIPEYVKPRDSIRFFVKLNKIEPAEIYKKKKAEKLAKYRKKEDSEIKQYIIKNELNAKNIGNRIFRSIHIEGKGKTINDSSRVKIHYTGLFTNHKVFSDTRNDNEAFSFNIGKEQVIPGLEKGLKGITEGSKLTLIIPFDQAYGSEKKGPVPPYSTLVFRIEVLDVKNS